MAVLTAPLALAGTTPPFTIGVESDGTVNIPGADATGDQATNPQDLYGNVKEPGPLNSNTTKIGVINSDAPPTLGLTNPNGQVDLRQAWLNTKKDSDGDDWVYFAWERDANSGSGFIAYEFMKNAAPTACDDYDFSSTTVLNTCNPWANRDGDSDGAGPDTGDFMILWDQQGGSKDLYYRKWIGTAPNLTLSPAVLLDPTVAVAAYSLDGFKGEAAINITDVVFGGTSSCLAFANIIPSTVTGNSDSADYKDTILQPGIDLANCASDVTTTPKKGDGSAIPSPFPITTAGYVEVKDSAYISLTGGTASTGGTIDFSLCKATADATKADCDGSATVIDNDKVVTDSDGDGKFPTTVVSSSAWVTAAGRYCWQAVYTAPANSGFLGDSDVSTGECFTVSPVTPTLSTTAGASVVLGNAVTDTATLTGTAPKPMNPVIQTTSPSGATRTPAGGSISFSLWGPSDTGCGSEVVAARQSVTVSGDKSGATSYGPASYTPGSPGTYHWKASYSGDSPNTSSTTHNDTCTVAAEDVTVTTVASSLTSAQTWVPSDSVTVSAPAGGALAGSVSFEFFTNGTCTGTAAFSTTKPVAGASPQTVLSGNAPAQTVTGSFSWRVSYTSTNSAQRSIAASCHETSSLTVANGGTISSS